MAYDLLILLVNALRFISMLTMSKELARDGVQCTNYPAPSSAIDRLEGKLRNSLCLCQMGEALERSTLQDHV